MNRVIKFRAWDKERKVIIPSDVFFLSMEDEYQPLKDSIEWSQQDFVIMQYTGFNCLSGVEVYEGDIIQFQPYSSNGISDQYRHWFEPVDGAIVEYALGSFVLSEISKSGKNTVSFSSKFHLDKLDGKVIRIIGNIYESKELMEKK